MGLVYAIFDNDRLVLLTYAYSDEEYEYYEECEEMTENDWEEWLS